MKRLIALLLCLVTCLSVLCSCIPPIFDNFSDLSPASPAYTDFTAEEKEIFLTYIGEVIPFIPTDSYELVEAKVGEGYSEGIRYYTRGNSEEDFEDYIALFSDYTLSKMNNDEQGNTWYHYIKGNIGVSMSYYNYNDVDFIDVVVYYSYNEPISEGTLSNRDAGLPEGENGVYNIDFTASDHAVGAKDLAKYSDGCPTVGSPAVLIIPIQFSDAPASDKGYTIEKIESIFNGEAGETDYYSVDEYYKISSYGQLDLDITVLDEWFTPEYNSTYYRNEKMQYGNENIRIGDQMILNEALDYLDDKMDLTKFDSDGNGTIDAVIMVNTLSVDSTNPFQWAYRYWNLYKNEENKPFSYDGVYALDYIWMSYAFMHEKVTPSGKIYYTDTSVMNPQTFIHEFGHILGAEDYYDTSYRSSSGPMKGNDIMDSELGDHNPYTKFIYGWLTESRLVTTDSQVTLTLTPFNETGDSIIIANNWDESLGAFQEYYILIYYKSTGLNSGEGGYHDKEGIVLYHVNATLSYEEYHPVTFYTLVNNNTNQGAAGLYKNLLEIVPAKKVGTIVRSYVFGEGNSLGTAIDDTNNLLGHTFRVDSISDGEAIITFTKK